MYKSLDLLDYDNCIANLPNSVLKHFGLEMVGKPLEVAEPYLQKNYKNIVVFLLDGLGTCILKENAKEGGFFKKHFVQSYKTVFPPTTVAATTSIQCGLQPIEHAWFGWDCYYPQIDKNVTVFPNIEQGTGRPAADYNVAEKYCGYESIVTKLNAAGKQAYNATPFLPPNPQGFEGVCARIKELCALDGEKYIYAYWTEPDSIMHRCGCYGEEAKQTIAELEAGVEKLCAELSDTLLIVTADHGHIENQSATFEDYPELLECLVRMPSIEPRAINLYVKPEKRAQFEREFNRNFGQNFLLLSKQEVYEKGLFGNGKPHPNADGMIGDYIALATTPLTLFNTKFETTIFRGVHAGYTKDELEIPFIVAEM